MNLSNSIATMNKIIGQMENSPRKLAEVEADVLVETAAEIKQACDRLLATAAAHRQIGAST